MGRLLNYFNLVEGNNREPTFFLPLLKDLSANANKSVAGSYSVSRSKDRQVFKFSIDRGSDTRERKISGALAVYRDIRVTGIDI